MIFFSTFFYHEHLPLQTRSNACHPSTTLIHVFLGLSRDLLPPTWMSITLLTQLFSSFLKNMTHLSQPISENYPTRMLLQVYFSVHHLSSIFSTVGGQACSTFLPLLFSQQYSTHPSSYILSAVGQLHTSIPIYSLSSRPIPHIHPHLFSQQ